VNCGCLAHGSASISYAATADLVALPCRADIFEQQEEIAASLIDFGEEYLGDTDFE
jgi:hypothetical protein